MKKAEIAITETSLTACGGKIKDASKYPAADHKGKTIYFCTEDCRQAFYSDPDGFMAGDVEHPE